MLFNSLAFIIFAGIFYSGFYAFKRSRLNVCPSLRYFYITLASLIFYGWTYWPYLCIIIFSIALNYSAALALNRFPRHRKMLLWPALLGNLGVLALFKYAKWFLGNIEAVAALLFGVHLDLLSGLPPFLSILPVGISFYTFMGISYLLDVYNKKLEPTGNILLYSSYLSLFPHLVAGPIVRAKDIFTQLQAPAAIDSARLYAGLERIAGGLFKKVVIADTLAPFVNSAFNDTVAHGGAFWWIVVLAFSMQIYCDFSGYSDIATGLAKWMGIDFEANFNHPYLADSVKEFWNRWHMTLSRWLRDYLYIPLGGSRVSPVVTYRNLWITMLASGLWHGAAWNFVFWGALHAVYRSLEQWRGTGKPGTAAAMGKGRIIISVSKTFLLVSLAWVFFRSQSLGQAFDIIVRLFNPSGFALAELRQTPFLVLLALGIIFARELYVLCTEKLGLTSKLPEFAFAPPLSTAVLLCVCLYYRGLGNAFIYFQF